MTFVPNPTITVFFGFPATGGDWFTLNDPVKGLLDGSYPLAGEQSSEIADHGYDVAIRRGRNRWLDDNQVGTCAIQFRNHDRIFDPLNTNGVTLIDSNGDGFIDEDSDELLSPTAPYLGRLIPGKRVTVSINAATIFDGSVEAWDVNYSADLDASASLRAEDGLGLLGRREFTEWTTTDTQLPGERIIEALDRGEINYGSARDIDPGVSALTTDLVTFGSNALNYLQLIAKSDLGNLYVSRDGVFTFRDRSNRYNANVAMAFSDEGQSATVYTEDGMPTTINEAPFVELQLESGSTLLYNRVSVDRVDGIMQTSNNSASQDEVGIRAMTLSGLLLDDDTQSQNLADYLLSLYSRPVERVASITVNVGALDDTQAAMTSRLDLDSLITVRVTPMGLGDPIDQLLFVEGVEHSIPVGGPHMMTLYLSLADSMAPFTLDHPVLGLLNGAGVLVY